MNTSSSIRAGSVGLVALLAVVLIGCDDPTPTRQELVNKGNWHFWRAEYVEAIGPYTAAYEQDPADPETLFKIGECHFYLGNYREASKWYRQTLKSFPGHKEATTRLEEANRRLPDFAPKPSSQTGPDVTFTPSPKVVAEGFINIARTHEAQNDPDRALECYKKAVEAADDMAFPHAELGRFYLRTGRNAEAIVQLKQAEKLNPAEPGVAEDLAKLGAK